MLSPERQPRKTLRFPLQTTITFWWTNGNGEKRQGEGCSRDLSDHGVFVVAPVCPPVGTNVVLIITLEGIPDGIGALPVELNGTVLRVEQSLAETGYSGFAIEY